MGWVCKTGGARQDTHTEFWSGNLMLSCHFEGREGSGHTVLDGV